MTISVNLIDDTLPVMVDDRTATMGGSFYYEPLRPYDGLPLKWCYEQLMKYKNATLIDVGANTGCYTLLSKHHPDLSVYAFEPAPFTRRILNENIYLNGLMDRVTVSEKGVSSYDGWGTLFDMKEHWASGVSMVNGLPAVHKDVIHSKIEVTTLDTYCEDRNIVPTFIKIDTEGGEKDVLKGAQRTIEKYHPFLLLEYSTENANQYGYATSDLVQMVEQWGYVWTCPEGLDLWCVPLNWETITNVQHRKG